MSELHVLIIFLSKLPVYVYVIHRAWIFRHALIVVSANWLGCLAFFGALSSISVIAFDRFIAGIIAYGVVLSLFMLAYTAREVKRIKE